MTTEFFTGPGLTIAALGFVTVVFGIALATLGRELRYIRSLTDFLGADLVSQDGARGQASLEKDAVRDEARAILEAGDPAWAQKQLRGWEMRAQRLETALVFWVDFLRQLGLLFTVVGLGLSLSLGSVDASQLLQPLGLAVWTTVAGLFYSILLSARYSMAVVSWSDACEKNIEAWRAQRVPSRGSTAG
jgi:hypothetical protein